MDQDARPGDIPHATMNTRIAQQVAASFGIAIVAVVFQSLLEHGATGAFHGAFWWAIGITVAALIPAVALPAKATVPAATGRSQASGQLHRAASAISWRSSRTIPLAACTAMPNAKVVT
ncbi:hypothetical protein ACWD4J_42545 [Streptomyces sp. NPDC002577]